MSRYTGRTAFSPHKRRIFEAMNDGKPHTPADVQAYLGLRQQGSATRTLTWMVRNGFAVYLDGSYKLNTKGRRHARNLDAGYDYCRG